MTRSLAAMTVWLIPGVALAGNGGDSGFSFLTCLLQMCFALAVVVGAVYLLSYLARRGFTGFAAQRGRRSYIRVVESRYLEPKKALLLVEVAGEYLLLGNSADGISLIKQIDMMEDAEVLAAEERGLLSGAGFQARLEEMMRKTPLTRHLAPFSRSEG